jgi:hypothetical protein
MIRNSFEMETDSPRAAKASALLGIRAFPRSTNPM